MSNAVTGTAYTVDDADDANNDDTNDNDTRWTNHDCIGYLACMPNEPKNIPAILPFVRFGAFQDTKAEVLLLLAARRTVRFLGGKSGAVLK